MIFWKRDYIEAILLCKTKTINNKNPYIQVQKSNLETILKIEFMKLTQFQLVYMRNTKIVNQKKKILNYLWLKYYELGKILTVVRMVGYWTSLNTAFVGSVEFFNASIKFPISFSLLFFVWDDILYILMNLFTCEFHKKIQKSFYVVSIIFLIE